MPRAPQTVEELKNTFEHVNIQQIPLDHLSAMGEAAAAHADVRLFEVPAEQGKHFEAGYWHNGQITGSRPERSRLEQGNTVAAFVSDSPSSNFSRGMFEVLAMGANEQSRPTLQQASQRRPQAPLGTTYQPQKRAKRGFLSMFDSSSEGPKGWS